VGTGWNWKLEIQIAGALSTPGAEIKALIKNREGRPERVLERMTRQSESRRGSVDRSTLLRVGRRNEMHRDSQRRTRCRAREESHEEKHEPALELNEKEPFRENLSRRTKSTGPALELNEKEPMRENLSRRTKSTGSQIWMGKNHKGHSEIE
jgi:hypothetical protein